MTNTYTQVYIHIVFAVKYREALLNPEWDERLRNYITAIVQNNGNKMLAINNTPDHIHLFFGLHTDQSISVLVQKIKADSTKWLNKEKLTTHTFSWQSGYGAFTYARSQIDQVVKYIATQKELHRNFHFRDEYIGLQKGSELNMMKNTFLKTRNDS